MPKKQQLVQQGMLDRARELRRDMTIPERMLWNLLRGSSLGGLKFRRQQPIGPYFVDYYCEHERLVIELDGDSHTGRADYDAERTRFLESRGLCVFRIGNDDVLNDLESVAHAILRAVGKPLPQ